MTAIGRDLAVRANHAYRLQGLSTAAAPLATELGDGAHLLVATPESGLPAKLVDDAGARAERMSLHREDELTIRLYGAGRFPLSRRWIRAYPGPHAVESLFGAAAMERDWILVARSEWLSYTRREAVRPG